MSGPAGGALLEREGELAELGASLAEARAGRGRMVVIEGTAGVGKTRLLQAVGEGAATEGFRVLSARGGDLERDLPYGVVRQLFELALRHADRAARTSLLDGPAGLAAVALLESAEGGAGSEAADRSYAVPHGLYWLTSNLAERAPLVLAVDDVHWSDRPSLRFLHYMARRVHDLPVLLVVTSRSADPRAQDELVRRISTDHVAAVLRPAPLSAAGVTGLVRGRLGPEAAADFCAACHTATEGNPFLVGELINALADDGVKPSAREAARIARLVPDSVARHVFARLVRLPAAAGELVRAVAVLGAGADLRLAGRMAELDYRTAVAAADALASAELLRPGVPLEFVHPLLREAIYAELPMVERAASHARAARLLNEAGASTDRIAAQLLAAAPVGEAWALEALRAAAGAALARGGPESAVSYLRRSLVEPLDTPVRARVLFELGRSEALVKGPATERLAEALQLEREPARRAVVAELLARGVFWHARPEHGAEVCERALEELGETHPELRARLEAELLLNALVEPSMADLAAELAARARAMGDPRGVGAKALIALGAYYDARAGRPAADVVPRAQLALGGGELLAEGIGGFAWICAASVLLLADTERALKTPAAALSAAQERGNMLAFAAARIVSCHARVHRGELVDAVADGSEALKASEGAELDRPIYSCAYLADALMERGELGVAQLTLERANAPEAIPNNDHWRWYRDSRARLLLLQGDLRQALEETLESGRRFEAVGGKTPAFMAWRSRAALCLTRLGEEPDRARALADEELELAAAFGAPRALGRALRIKGMVEGGEGALRCLRDAVDVLEPSPARLELAYALCELGAVLRRDGEHRAAREPLRRAVELAHACGAAPLQERAREELLGTGARPRRLPVSGLDALTPSERRVSAMAAEGLSNREIAQALFVSLKTVETHLSHAYRKLELESRSELPRALAPSPGSGVSP